MKRILIVTSLLFVSAILTGQNIGIGTTTPQAKLHVKNLTSSNSFSGLDPTMIVEDSGHTILHIAGNTGSSSDHVGIKISDHPYESHIHFYGPSQQLNIGIEARDQLLVHSNGIIVHNQTINPSRDNSAVLQMVSINRGLLIPRLNFSQRQLITSPATSLLIYQTDNDSGFYFNASTPLSPQWKKFLTTSDQVFERVDSVSLVRRTSDYATDDFIIGRDALPPAGSTTDKIFFFNKSKSAFRVGAVGSDAWAPQHIGELSFASGLDTRATGTLSTAMGSETIASGFISTALGDACKALGYASLAAGNASIARGDASIALGLAAESIGQYSTAAGFAVKARGYASFVVGQYNDTAATSTNSWILTDPVFIVGNGTTNSLRKNALTILKGGQIGVNTKSPIGTLHIKATATDESQIVMQSASNFFDFAKIRYEDEHVIFQNTDPQTTFWDFRDNNGDTKISIGSNGTLGINKTFPVAALHIKNTSFDQNHLVFQNALNFTDQATIRYFDRRLIFQSTDAGGSFWDFRNNSGLTQIIMGSNGDIDMKGDLTLGPFRKLGVNTTNPSAPVHVIKNAVSGGPFYPNANMVLEDNDHSYLQFSTPDSKEAGILSGNSGSTIRSAMIFSTDNSLRFKTGGTTTRMTISNSGDVGVGTTSPAATLDVNGDFKLGAIGTVLASVIKVTVAVNLSPIASGATHSITFTIPNVTPGATAMVSPEDALVSGLVIAAVRVSAANTVEVRFTNTSAGIIDQTSMEYYITVIK